jgi:hypothetical protein
MHGEQAKWMTKHGRYMRQTHRAVLPSSCSFHADYAHAQLQPHNYGEAAPKPVSLSQSASLSLSSSLLFDGSQDGGIEA